MQFQNKAIIHSTATDSLFIDIVQFDVYRKIRSKITLCLGAASTVGTSKHWQLGSYTVFLSKSQGLNISLHLEHTGMSSPVYFFPFTGLRDPSCSTHAHKSTSICKTLRQVAWAFGHLWLQTSSMLAVGILAWDIHTFVSHETEPSTLVL